MDPTLTRSQAHNVFGELYRKERPPELQKKVDQVVRESSDVFVRIKRIEEIDAQAERKSGRAVEKKSAGQRGRSSGSGSSPGKGASGKGGGGELSFQGKKQSRPAGKTTSVGFNLFSPDFWVKMVGGELALWGKQTGTFDLGFLGFNVNISQSVMKMFYHLNEQQIIASIKCLRGVMKYGWEKWDPATYNTVVAGYQFFNEFVQVSSLFSKQKTVSSWINQTMKMQTFYASLLKYPDYARILTEVAPELAEQSDELSNHVPKFRESMKYIVGLENRRPSMIDAILAFYAITTRKLYQWENIQKQLDIKEPELERFRGPESVLAVINGRIKKLRNEIQAKKKEIQDIEQIRKKYFSFDEQGRLQTKFLNGIIFETAKRLNKEGAATEQMVKNVRSQPHLLLYYIIRDFDFAAATILEGAITIQSQGSTEEVIIFRQGLLRGHLDEVDHCLRELETFNRKNNTFSYDFNRFRDDIDQGQPRDQQVAALHQIIGRLNKAFRALALDLHMIMENHEMAVRAAQSGQAKDKLLRTKEISVEVLDVGMRFLPHAERILFSSNRLAGKKVEDALNEILMNLYNYLYIFRDTEIVRTLNSSKKVEEEINSMQAELDRLGDQPGAE